MALSNKNYLIVEETIKFVQNTTLEAVDVKFGGVFEIASGVTVTINGPFTDNGLQRQIFTGVGSVIFAKGSVPRVNVVWFGADPYHKNTDATTRAFQTALDSSHAIGEVFVPAGHYSINNTLHIGKNSKGFHSTWFHGPTNGSDTSLGVRLNVTFHDKPGINIEAARGTKISNIDIRGENNKPNEVSTVYPADPSNWVDNLDMIERFSAYCGICTDQFGLEDENGEKHASSAHVAIEDCYISGFGVGIVIAHQGTFQNDTIKVNRNTIEGCAYGIAVGTGQARTCRFVDNRINRCHTAFDNLTFGEETSSSTFNTDSNQITNCRNVYNIATIKGGQCVLSGDYVEACGKIGNFGKFDGHSVGQGVLIQGGYYSVSFWEDLPQTIAADCSITFNRCTLWPGGEIARNFYINPRTPTAKIVFDNCDFLCHGAIAPRVYFRLYHERQVHFRECRLQSRGKVVTIKQQLSDHLSYSTPLSEPERLKLYLHTQTISVHRISGLNNGYFVEEAVSLPVSAPFEKLKYSKDVAGFDLRIMTAKDSDDRKQLIFQFEKEITPLFCKEDEKRSDQERIAKPLTRDECTPILYQEYKKNINTNVVLAIDIANKTTPDWIIAGLDDAGKFIQLTIDDVEHELAIALDQDNPKNLQTLELLTDTLGSSFDISVVTFTPKENSFSIINTGDLLYWSIIDPETEQKQEDEEEKKPKQTSVLPILEVRSIDESGNVEAALPTWMRREIKLNTKYNPNPVIVSIWSEPWAVLSGEITGDLTLKSPEIDNVENVALLEVGDFIAGEGLPARARVTEINNTTVTLNLEATATLEGVRLDNAILRSGV